MESLLNILWLMLVLPALVVGWRAPKFARSSTSFARARAFVLMCCVLALLFPVVSATDDLRALQTEVEESGTAKYTIKHFVSYHSHSTATGNGGSSIALLLSTVWFPSDRGLSLLVDNGRQVLPNESPSHLVRDRAPPSPKSSVLSCASA